MGAGLVQRVRSRCAAEYTGPGYDVTDLLKQKHIDPEGMFRIGERFFTSLGLPKLPATFWQRSLLVKPRGDAIALSITPDYLKTIGLLDSVPSPAADTMLLLRKALEKVAFLPFGLLIDEWRWKVFSGAVKPNEYNSAWWDLRGKYQGVAPPVARTAADFDPGAKYHVPANTPYARYFLAAILQMQFYRALCREAGWTGPLYRCSFYGNRAAGTKLQEMLSLGASKPWPDALSALTG